MSESREFQEVGQRLRALRTGLGMSQRELCSEHGFSPAQYNNWERGARRLSIEYAQKLCDSYGLTLDYIYRGRVDGLTINARKLTSGK
jgi:transcriptional regulator with XRE-family HTH domain